MNKENIKNIKFPKNFFNIKRPNISNEKRMEDISPIEWKKGNKEIIIHSTKEKNNYKIKENKNQE